VPYPLPSGKILYPTASKVSREIGDSPRFNCPSSSSLVEYPVNPKESLLNDS
jgi:hypothetical protein